MMNISRLGADVNILRTLRRLVPAVSFIITAGLVPASPGGARVSADLQRSSPGGVQDVIVQFRAMPSKDQVERIVAKGGKLRRGFVNIPAAVFRLPTAALDALVDHPEVVYVSPDRSVTGRMEFAGPAVGADIAFNSGWTGAGIGIAIVDSGINSEHPDVKGRIVWSENFVAGETTTEDVYGHGTHVAVASAGNAFASTGNSFTVSFRGVAPRANLINLRVLDATGRGADSAVIAAIDRAIQLKAQYNIRVLNLSLGRRIVESFVNDPLCLAVERAWRAGIVVVVAAGNNGRDDSIGTAGYGTVSAPANSPHVITVGAMKDMGTATRADDLMTSYSSKGPTLIDQVVKPDLVAPGNLIISGVSAGASIRSLMPDNIVPVTYYRVSSTTNTSTVYFRLSGTSIAAPVVSGAAALLLQKNPALTPDQVKARLMKTASKSFPATSTAVDPATGVTYQITYDLFTVGAGYLDIAAALSNNELSSGAATSPRATVDAADGSIAIVFSPETVWGDAVIWGSAVVWGSNVIRNGDAMVWGTAVIWGSQSSSGFAVIWGSDSVFANSDPFLQAVSASGER